MQTESASAARLPRFNPFQPGFREDPYPVYQALRAHNPVHQSLGLWVVTRRADVRQLMMDRTISVDHVPAALRAAIERGRGAAAAGVVEFAEKSIVFTDGAEHARLRKAVSPFFAPAALAHVRGAFAGICRAVTADIVQSEGAVDMVEAFAKIVPDRLLGHLFALDAQDIRDVRIGTGAIRSLLEPRAAGEAAISRAVNGLDSAKAAFSRARRRQGGAANPSQGFMLRMLDSLRRGGGTLSDAEIELMAVMVYVAGLETTAGLIANACLALADNPAEQRALRHNPARAEAVIRETLRYEAPLQMTMRTTVAPIVLNGCHIPMGATILLCLGSANRDETAYDEPDRFVADRAGPPHLGLGTGLHACLGAVLAQIEAEEAIIALVAAAHFERANGTSVEWSAHSSILRAPKQLPMVLRRVA